MKESGLKHGRFIKNSDLPW